MGEKSISVLFIKCLIQGEISRVVNLGLLIKNEFRDPSKRRVKPADPDFISFDAVAGAQEDESDDDYVPQGDGTEDESPEVFQKRKSEPSSPKKSSSKSSSNDDEKPTKETSTRTSKRISKRTLKSKPATEGILLFNLNSNLYSVYHSQFLC